MILVDTSVWIDHLRAGEPLLVELPDTHRVLIHSSIHHRRIGLWQSD
jgi:predicted nucleic acid-binding protein